MGTRDSVDIFSYQDPREYLRNVLTDRKNRDRSFRLSNFSRKAGFSSPSLLSMLLNGQRNFAPTNAEKLATTLGLTGRRKNYFLAMARSHSARTLDEKTEAGESMLMIKSKAQKLPLEIKQYQVLSNWLYSVIYILAGMKKISWNPEKIAKKIGKNITAEQIKIAVADLLSLGLLRLENGKLKRLALNLTTLEDVQALAIRRYHSEMIRLAGEALALPLEQREMNGVTVGIPRKHLPIVKEKIRNFRKELNDYLSQLEEEADDVFQIHIQLFPLTKMQNEKESE